MNRGEREALPRGPVLVTGAAGFIGSRLVEVLTGRGVGVIAVDSLVDRPDPAAEREERLARLGLNPNVETYRLDVLEPAFPDLVAQAGSVVNLAARVGLDPAIPEAEYERSNVEAVEAVVRASATAGIGRLVHASTSSVYGRIAAGGEGSPLEPISPYGRTKLAGERVVGRAVHEAELPATILRYFSVYGPGQRPDMGYRTLIDAVLCQREFSVFGDPGRGRSSTYVDDVVEATVSALTAPADSVVGETFNVTGDETIALSEAIEVVEQATGLEARLRYLPPREGDQERTAGDSSKAERVLGFRPTVRFREGIARQVEWQRERLGARVAPGADRNHD